jgi:chemotaxis protein methyltransferase CheR
MSAEHEAALQKLIARVAAWTGIDLDRGGRGDSLERFLATRLHTTGQPSIEAYVASLTGPTHPEVARLINSITVSHTWFFRDPDQLAVISKQLATGWPAGRRVSIWVAGCATGEDVYTLAMLADRAGRPATVHGTDINSEALAQARAGRYGDWAVRDVPPALRPFYLPQRLPDGRFDVSPLLRQAVSFQHLNLRDPSPPAPTSGGWDLIVCRNVLIYFSAATALTTVADLGRALAPGGWLHLGASELINTVPSDLEAVRFGERYALRRRETPATPRVPLPATMQLPPPPPSLAEPTPDPGAQEDAVRHIELGNVKLDAGNLAGALAEYAKALELDPLSTEARLYTGIAYHMEDDFAAAAQALRAALFLDPELWPASFYLALSYEKLGREGDARREYQRVVETSAGTPSIKSRGGILRNLEAWRRDVMMLAKKRARA